MPKPPTSTRTVRLPDATWALIAERAAAAGDSVNGHIAKLIARGLQPPRTLASIVETTLLPKPAPQPKAVSPTGLTYGYNRPKPGSRLKVKK